MGDQPTLARPKEARRQTGRLGVAAIILGLSIGNGPAFPAGYVIGAVILAVLRGRFHGNVTVRIRRHE